MRSSCPYRTQPASAIWRDAVARVAAEAVDPVIRPSFNIDRKTVIGSAGSCFAQHIRNQLVRRGYNYLITEPGPASATAEEREDRLYGIFPARFGNIYTTVQLLQLFEMAYGKYIPEDDYWIDKDGYVDPFRPHVEPEGFASLELLREDRLLHLGAVRRFFEEVEVFVFTLGLTEAWRNQIDGAVYPVCPGCSVGEFDARRHEFVNFGVKESREALFLFVENLRLVNPHVRIVFTVSPVPLAATMTKHHVIEATTYSKAVLRVVAEEARETFECVEYFPSYEIITATNRNQRFFAGDRRTVTTAGVQRVMDLFFHHYAGEPLPATEAAPETPARVADAVVCDEEQALAGLQEFKS